MAKRVGLGIIGLLIAYFTTSYYVQTPTRQAKGVAFDFWTAVVAGDEARVESLLAPDATRTAAEWIEVNRGLPLLTDQVLLTEIGVNNCGVKWVAIVTLRTPEGNPSSRISSLKLVNGQWRVRTPEGILCEIR